jgi:type III pantothenate kinase
MNYLLIDIGNSRLKLVAQADQGVPSPLVSVPWSDAAACRSAISAGWDLLPAGQPRRAVLGSVHPGHLASVRQVLAELKIPGQVLREEIPLPMELAVDHPETVGVDRVCAAAAAYAVLQCPLVVASFGTAVTVDAVNAEGVFLGGAILPGMESKARALHVDTAQLPEVKISIPSHAIGCNTTEAIQSGVLYGLIGALRELVEKFAEQLGGWPIVVVTGGGAPLILEAGGFVGRYVENLTLLGLRRAAEKCAARPPADS